MAARIALLQFLNPTHNFYLCIHINVCALEARLLVVSAFCSHGKNLLDELLAVNVVRSWLLSCLHCIITAYLTDLW